MPTTAQAYGATFTVTASGGTGTGLVSFAGTGACSVNSGERHGVDDQRHGHLLGDGDQGLGRELRQHNLGGGDGFGDPGHAGSVDRYGHADDGASLRSDVHGWLLRAALARVC